MKFIQRIIVLFLITFFLVFPSKIAAQTTQEVKIAFIGDSAAGSSFKQVLNLIKGENVQLILQQGDLGYSAGASGWTAAVNSVFPASFPFLASDGNHDDWGTYVPFFQAKLNAMGVTPTGSLSSSSYAVVYKGIKIVFTKEGGNPTFIDQQFTGDTSAWRICSWHKNQKMMQVGGKGDEQGWGDYENCRKHGAIVATGHEHSYGRTKTLTNTQNQTIDSSCPNANQVCVAPGKTFVFHSGIGGNGIRDQASQASLPYWAKVYTTNQNAQYGALFITFNAGGNPNLAKGYLKNISGQTVDQFDVVRAGVNVTVPPVTSGPTITIPADCAIAKSFGDANCDRTVNLADFEIWRKEFTKLLTTKSADFNKNGTVDISDFETWRSNYLK
jgi:hypothetical protein